MSTKSKRKVYQVTSVHTSGRYDRSLKSLLEGIRGIVARRKVTTISGTEAKGRPTGFMDKVKSGEWDWAHGTATARDAEDDTPFGTKECWLMWRTDTWGRVGKVRSVVMNQRQYRTSSGNLMPKARAHKVMLMHIPSGVVFIWYIVHMPLDNTELRASIWFECCEALAADVAETRLTQPNAHIVIQGDINKNYRQDLERALMETHIARPTKTKQAWKHNVPKTGGTHGPLGLIDGTFTDTDVDDCALLPDDPSSDHRPYRVRLSFTR